MDISHDFYKSFREYTSKSQSLDEFVLGFRLKSIGMLKKAHITLLLVNLGLHAAACGEVSDPADPSYAPDQYIAPMDASGALLDQGVPRPITNVSVATFNVRKFFDTNCDTRNCGPGQFEAMPTDSEFRAKAQQIANGIRILEADILLLQEIETQTCLDTLLEALSDQGYTTAVLGETGGSASLDVAVVSKVPVVGRRSYQDVQIPLPNGGSTTFSRDLLEVHLDYGDSRVIVFNAHFKAKTRDDPDRRLAEATAARDIVTAVAEEEPNALVVLGGDLNDTPGSAPITALERQGQMLRVAAELSPNDATYTFQGVPQAIDHLYLVETVGGRFVDGTARVVRSNTRGLAGSDHAGVVGLFEALATP